MEKKVVEWNNLSDKMLLLFWECIADAIGSPTREPPEAEQFYEQALFEIKRRAERQLKEIERQCDLLVPSTKIEDNSYFCLFTEEKAERVLKLIDNFILLDWWDWEGKPSEPLVCTLQKDDSELSPEFIEEFSYSGNKIGGKTVFWLDKTLNETVERKFLAIEIIPDDDIVHCIRKLGEEKSEQAKS